jgi:hypothetical protein
MHDALCRDTVASITSRMTFKDGISLSSVCRTMRTIIISTFRDGIDTRRVEPRRTFVCLASCMYCGQGAGRVMNTVAADHPRRTFVLCNSWDCQRTALVQLMEYHEAVSCHIATAIALKPIFRIRRTGGGFSSGSLLDERIFICDDMRYRVHVKFTEAISFDDEVDTKGPFVLSKHVLLSMAPVIARATCVPWLHPFCKLRHGRLAGWDMDAQPVRLRCIARAGRVVALLD